MTNNKVLGQWVEEVAALTRPDQVRWCDGSDGEYQQLVKEMLENDLQVEYTVAVALKEAIKVCEEEQDYDTRRILVKLLDDTEMDHAYWLEQQLGLIEHIGLKNYLQSQMGDEPNHAG